MEQAGACEDFLTHRRLAVVGVSRDPRDFSRAVVAELTRRGYDVVPVNPIGGDGRDGIPFVRRLQDIVPPVKAALLMTPPAVTTEVVKDCAEAGIRHVWMHQGMGRGAASPAAISVLRDHDISVITRRVPPDVPAGSGLRAPRAPVVPRSPAIPARGWGRDRLRLPALTGRPGAANAPADTRRKTLRPRR